MEAELPNQGGECTFVADTQVVVVRDTDHQINVLDNKCPHRATLVCLEAHGSITEFTCMYHQRSYDLKGHPRGALFRYGMFQMERRLCGLRGDFDPAYRAMRRVKVEKYHGVIFATFRSRKSDGR